MNIIIKTPEQIEGIRKVGRIAADVLDMITPYVVPGVTTDALEERCHHHITEVHQAISATLGYHGFPKSVCISPNSVICHGIPNSKPLKNGDIINIDVTVIKDGFYGDTSRMYIVGKPSIQAQRLCQVAKECLDLGIECVAPGVSLRTVAQTIQRHAESNGFSVVRDYCGHGTGLEFHEDPQVLHFIPSYPDQNTQVILQPGMTFTIEPMINAGGYASGRIRADGWTVHTKDRSLSAQWEHTLAVTENGFDILTL